MKINEKGLNIVKFFEGYKHAPYLCPANVWTIGWGSTKDLQGRNIKEDHPSIDEATAETYLLKGLETAEKAVDKAVEVVLTDNQYSALVSFVYNIGSGNFRSSTLLKLLNNEDYQGASEEFSKWRIAKGKVLKGLVDRRSKEQELFTTN